MSKISSRSTRTWSVSGTCLALWTRSSSLSISTRTSMALPSSSARQRFLQALRDFLRYEVGDVATERGDLLHSAGGEKTVLRRGHQVDGLDVWREIAVELIHLQLVFEVGDRTQALHDRHRPSLAGEIDHEGGARLHRDVVQMGGRPLDE